MAQSCHFFLLFMFSVSLFTVILKQQYKLTPASRGKGGLPLYLWKGKLQVKKNTGI